VVIPTPVDTDRFVPGAPVREPIIGWTGTKGSLKYLHDIEPELAAVLREIPQARLRIICDARPDLSEISPDRVEFVPWSASIEVAAMQGMALGIMPLQDTPWARGKCSFKMLSYMACGLPVVVSPVGMNREVLKQGDLGLAAGTSEAWVDALIDLLRDPDMRHRMGQEGRRVAVEKYSTRCLAPVLARALAEFAGKRENS
jgi:glycosyltransferase involved in cell wall biosynthesis